ncbi:hypothetical protein AURDEDRAFT_176872 [Auricularia subglabra TFB-10046 SS5]|uniref:Uncharacterized protein n=1 Tax=Auricularia subglabra (strain TFB-10046 / SS5) TaxID=717982 RepID=J0LC69_AURST|nr:hypothetical protein AURDEDRAFT_176872 [Auricularia subglabra TFB-10046 SS5]
MPNAAPSPSPPSTRRKKANASLRADKPSKKEKRTRRAQPASVPVNADAQEGGAGPSSNAESAVGASGFDELKDMQYADKSPAYAPVTFDNHAVGMNFRFAPGTSTFKNVEMRPCPIINVKGVSGQATITHFIILIMVFEDCDGRKIRIPTKLYVNEAEGERIILGNDFAMYYGGIVDVPSQRLTLTENVSDRIHIDVRVKRDVHGSVRATECLATRCVYLEPAALQGGKVLAAAAARAIDEVTRREHLVEIYNLEPFPLMVSRGQILGRALPLLDRSRAPLAASLVDDQDEITEDNLHEFDVALQELDINPELSDAQRTRLLDVLRTHRQAGKPLRTARVPSGILTLQRLGLMQEMRRQQLRHPFASRPEVARLLANNVIEPAGSPWAANVVVIKQRGKIRFCLDYRKLNAVSRSDQYRIRCKSLKSFSTC